MRIGLGLSIPELATRGGRFSPASLFTGGTVGAWYDPSDTSTLFQDSAGTTPVTAVEQPVGLMLDKSQGLVLGSELVTNGDFATSSDWTLGSGWTISGGAAVATSAASGATVIQIQTEFVSGRLYKFTYTVVSVSAGGFSARFEGQTGTSRTTPGTYTEYFFSTGATQNSGVRANGTTTGSVTNISVKELPGNHASQATSTSRPVLRARYNNLTYSEQFDNAAWNKVKASITPNAAVAPDGTTTADLLTVTADGYAYATVSGLTVANSTLSCYFKAGTTSVVTLDTSGSANALVTFDLVALTATLAGSSTNTSASITDVGNGWRRCIVTRGSTAGTQIYIGKSSALTGETFYVWGADLRTGSSAGTYQRIAAATDYATAGFLPYLYFVTDDSFGTGSINFSATDKMSVCAGVTKLSDAAAAMVVELSVNAVLNAGAFNIQAPATGGNAEYQYGGGGTIFRSVLTSSYAAPTTNVLAATQDIVGDAMSFRVNGVSVGTSALDQGTGNFGNYPLYIGRRNNASLPFEGRIYGLIVCGKTLSASELSATEAWMAAKTGVTI